MNQTNSSIEEIVEKMLAIGWDSKMKKHDGTSIVVSFTKAELCELLLNLHEQHHQELQKAREEERDRCTDIIAHHCSFAMENSKSQDIRNFASSLANRLYSVITMPDEDQSELDQPISDNK